MFFVATICKKRFVLTAMCMATAATFVLNMGLFFYWFYHSPSNANPETGEICQLRGKGRIFYVTTLQNGVHDALMYIFGVLMFFIVVLRIYWEVSSPRKDSGKSQGVR
jgi:flagellar biosynthesis protein FlhB